MTEAKIKTLKQLEGDHILDVLIATQGEITSASAALGISRSGLYRKIIEHRLDLDAIRGSSKKGIEALGGAADEAPAN